MVMDTKIDENARMKLIFERAIANAQKHNIELEPGRENSGGGNCSYLSVIYNINDRVCFQYKYNMSSEYYRRVWTIDMMNKILDEKIPWNPGMTRMEIQAGFQEMMESGVYERNYFGDMMMAGIACGVRKRILIFNTHEETKHDPISVVDPRDYGGDMDSEIPVVVAYNLVHFESLHPVNEKDIQETVKLVESYSSGNYKEDYGFTKQSMPFLVSTKKTSGKEREPHQIQSPPKKKPKCFKTGQTKVADAAQKNYKNKEATADDPGQSEIPPTKKSKYFENASPLATKKNETETERLEEFIFEGILFKEMEDGKMKCGVCKTYSSHEWE